MVIIMNLKKLLAAAVITAAAVTPLAAYASSVSGTLVSENAQINIDGILNTDKERYVTLKIYDEEKSVVYIDQKLVNGDYSFKCNINDASKQYTYDINCGGERLNDTISHISASNTISYNIELNNIDEARLDLIFENPLGLKKGEIDRYKPILAFYKEGQLISAKVFQSGSFEFDKEKITFTAPLPKGTDFVKAFLWSDTVDMRPLTDSEGQKADNVMIFFGDSITKNGFHQNFIEHYYTTRFPNAEIKYVNAGIAGQTAKQGIDRLTWDVLSENPSQVFMMWGMNDCGIDLYQNGGTDAQKQAKIDESLRNIESLINIFEAQNIKVVLATPSAYDEGDYGAQNAVDITVGYNKALEKLGDGIKALADKYDLQVVDLWKFTTEVANNTRTANGKGGMIINYPDRMHPQPAGGVAMAYKYIKDMRLPEVVASVEINAITGEIIADNASVNVISNKDSAVEYTYLAKSIPLALTDNYKTASKWSGVALNSINQELIKVTGLSEGTYKISYDGNEVLQCSANELEQGVNIAENENNPAQKQSLESMEYTAAIDDASIRVNYTSVKQELSNLGILNDEAEIREYIAENPDKAETYTAYLNVWTENEKKRQNAKNSAKPKQYTVTIEKIN